MTNLAFSSDPSFYATGTETDTVVTVSKTAPPFLEIVLDPQPEVEVSASETSGGTVPQLAPIIELVPSAAEPVVDIILEEAAIVDIAAVGMQGPQGSTGPQGPQGEEGAQGQPGAGSFFASFNFASPSTEWVITHNRGTYAIVVETFTQSGDPIEGTVTYPDPNTIVVDWFYPTAGEARIFS